MRMIKPPGKVIAGQVWLDGRDLLAVPDDQMPRLRLAENRADRPGLDELLNPVMR